jgi:hypothetical protein
MSDAPRETRDVPAPVTSLPVPTPAVDRAGGPGDALTADKAELAKYTPI